MRSRSTRPAAAPNDDGRPALSASPPAPGAIPDAAETVDDGLGEDPAGQPATPALLAAFSPPERRPLRQLPALVVKALQLMWQSGKPELLALAGLQIAGACLMAGQVLVLRRLLTIVTMLGAAHASAGRLTAPAIVLVTLVGVMGMIMIAQNSIRNVLSALVTKTASDRILDVTTTVPLIAFDDAAFHDRLARAVVGQHRPLQLVQSLTQLAQSATGLLAVTAALAIVNPLLLPLVFLAFVPMTISAAGSGRDMYLLPA